MVFAFIGEVLHHFIPLPIPASIYGIIFLFLALECKVLKVKDIKETSSFLIAIMPIMFLPPAVGIVESWGLIRGAWLPYVVVIGVSTVVVMAVSGRVTQRMVRKGGRAESVQNRGTHSQRHRNWLQFPRCRDGEGYGNRSRRRGYEQSLHSRVRRTYGYRSFCLFGVYPSALNAFSCALPGFISCI